MPVFGKGSRTANASRVAQGTEDVNFTLPNNTDHIILGCGVGDDDGERMQITDQFNLQWRTGVDAFVNLATTGVVKFGATNLVEGNAVLVGERLSTGLFGSFINGEEKESINPDNYPAEVRDNTTEIQWSLDFSGAVASTQYDFQVIWAHKGGSDTISYISITTAAAGGTDFPLDAQPGSFALTGIVVNPDIAIPADLGAFNLTGIAATTDIGLNAQPATFVLTGVAAILLTDYILDAQPGAFSLMGFAAPVVGDLLIDSQPASYTITGLSVNPDIGIPADLGSFTLTGANAGLIADYVIDSQAGTFAITGVAASIVAGYIIDAQPGAFSLTGLPLTSDFSMDATPAVYVLTGTQAGLIADFIMDAQPGVFTLTGVAATLVLTSAGAFELDAQPGVFTITGINADLGEGGVIYVSTRSRMVTLKRGP